MRILLDANIIVGLSEKGRRPIAAKAIKKLRADGHELFIVPQVLYEFWVVATRPENANGLGFSKETVAFVVMRALTVFEFIDDCAGVYTKWFDLVQAHNVLGKQAHDARLVAAMTIHGLDAILTQNGRDLNRYKEIKVIDPRQASAASM